MRIQLAIKPPCGKTSNQTPSGVNRENPASAGYHETHPKVQTGAAYTIPHIFYLLKLGLSSKFEQNFNAKSGRFSLTVTVCSVIIKCWKL
jgi:hypothetical protein